MLPALLSEVERRRRLRVRRRKHRSVTEFCPTFVIEDLLNLPIYDFYPQLMINGKPRRTFDARFDQLGSIQPCAQSIFPYLAHFIAVLGHLRLGDTAARRLKWGILYGDDHSGECV
jgi:hypothetical protein